MAICKEITLVCKMNSMSERCLIPSHSGTEEMFCSTERIFILDEVKKIGYLQNVSGTKSLLKTGAWNDGAIMLQTNREVVGVRNLDGTGELTVEYNFEINRVTGKIKKLFRYYGTTGGNSLSYESVNKIRDAQVKDWGLLASFEDNTENGKCDKVEKTF